MSGDRGQDFGCRQLGLGDRRTFGIELLPRYWGGQNQFSRNDLAVHQSPAYGEAGSPIPRDDNIGNVVRVDFPQTPPLPFSPLVVGLVDAAVFSLVPALTQGRTLSPHIIDNDAPAILVDRVTAVNSASGT